MVLLTHLVSLPKGFLSVEKELKRLAGKGWYEVFSHPPFAPWKALPQGAGATARKLEPDRWRRTTDGGAPRTELLDTEGNVVGAMPGARLSTASRPVMAQAGYTALGIACNDDSSASSPPMKRGSAAGSRRWRA